MLINKNFKFNISISTECFKQKLNNKEIWKVEYNRQQSTTVDNLIDAVLQGYWYCGVFRNGGYTFKQAAKAYRNFCYNNLVSLDIDNQNVPMKSFIDGLTYKPTFAYTTPSNGIKGYRYRIVYCFDTPLKGKDNYDSVRNAIEEVLTLDGYNDCVDKQAKACTQQMGGTIEGADTYTSYCVYNATKDFGVYLQHVYDTDCNPDLPTLYKSDNESAIKNNIREEKRDNINLNCTFGIDQTFLEDIRVMRPLDFINKWGKVYDYYTHSELDFKDGYALIPEDYVEIYRSWFVVEENEKKHSRIHKWVDGEQRRKHLFIAALIMRKIRPEITLEHLVFNLVVERHHYYNNQDNQLNADVLIKIAESVINKPLEDIRITTKRKKGKFVVDKEYWAEYGVNANQAKQIIKGEMKDFEIGNLYDCLLTDKQNIEVMKEYGLEISLRTLKNWRKKYGITKYNKSNSNNESAIKNNIKKEKEDNINLNCTFEDTFSDPNYIEPFDNTYTVTDDNSYDVEDYYYPVTNDVFASIVGVSTAEDWAELQAKFDALPSYHNNESDNTIDTFDVDPYIYSYNEGGVDFDTTDENNIDYNDYMNNVERERIESNIKEGLDEKLQNDWDKAMKKELSAYAQALWDDLMTPSKENNRVWVSTLDF